MSDSLCRGMAYGSRAGGDAVTSAASCSRRPDPEIPDREDRAIIVFGQYLPRSFQVVDDAKDCGDTCAEAFDFFDGLEHRASGCQDVVDDCDPIAGVKSAFNSFPAAMRLGFFTNEKTFEGPAVF